ncbi:MAG: rRNA maturation RNase YbeY [bacterium]|nr:rRNA maturation RNase YbeY [bacterium]
MAEVLIANYQKKRVRLRDVRFVVSEVLREEGVDDGEVSVVLSDDKFIKDLNRKFRGVNEETDVLAFDYSSQVLSVCTPHPLLGEIIVSTETCAKQAREYKHSFREELSLLLIHGVLHLLGYDHKEEDEGARKMRKREKELLAKCSFKRLG